MKKITDYTEEKLLTRTQRDEYGNRVQVEELYEFPITVNSIKPGPRFAHFLADFILYSLITRFLFLEPFLYFNPEITMLDEVSKDNLIKGFLFSILFSVMVFGSGFPTYCFIFEFYFQRTPGKYLTSSYVIDEYLNKPSRKQLLLRSIVRIINPFDALSCIDNPSRGWHDKWSKTYVVTEEELKRLQEIKNMDTTQIA
ncbi:RDD family protein [Flammeovirga agarivorans]|uniref:RDD family protein n=1 Tax=Flammeovirga agarivorans TaxID=2726742 RepID=A0A7X8XZE0_9BACT|nr:RDD family protein [Flammeovirga agarivorans]NLR95087.1 RDD family protein [Flammeovirga agarivorans]